MSESSDINATLEQMHATGGTGKGTVGERAVLQICESFYQDMGGILFHSYSYAVDKDLPGNIKCGEDGHFYVENLGTFTEIDVMYVSPYRVFPIEVKAYAAKKITLTDDRIQGCYKTDKSPVHQNEMHCRHLYSHIYKALPNGDTRYIIPIVCFVDHCDIEDKRSDWARKYIPVINLNYLKGYIARVNKPLEYRLDLNAMDRVLTEAQTSVERKFNLRIV